MVRPQTRIARLLVTLILFGVVGGSPSAMLGAEPAPAVAWPVPPRVPDGPLTLADGTVLPVAPASLFTRQSVQAEMAADHADDKLTFMPGARPAAPLAGPGAALAWPSSNDGDVVSLDLADPSSAPAADLTALPNGLRKEVVGFLPYWMLDASDLQWMQYQLVSTIAFFGVAAKSDGTLATYATGWTAWNSSAMTGVINAAHARGVKVVLTVTMMAWDASSAAQQSALLGSATARTNVINAIVATVRARNADGVNLDFEPVAVADRDRYTSFVRQLKAALVSAGVGSYVTVCTMAGAGTWATGYDLSGLVAPGGADQLFVMGYDYSWSGSARAGGVAPMDSPYILDVNESVTDYLQIVPGSKIIWGVPYYGRTWRTQSNVLNALTVAGAASSSVAYWYTGNVALAARYGRLWDSVGKVPWFRYYDSAAASWVEGYYDDAVSLAAKWDMVNQRGLAGTGMWTLLMDAGYQELWNLLANKFVTDTTPPTGGITTLPATTDGLAVPVSWRAIDVGSGVLDYSVQYRERPSGAWTPWLTNTTATSAAFAGQPGRTYEFRVSAGDRRGNRQPWAGSAPDPGAAIAPGGFAQVVSDVLNVRAGAGTGFEVIDQLTLGDRVAVLAGPIANGGFNWYQIQFAFTEWPSADYPRVGWSAAGSGATPYLSPGVAPTVTTLNPSITSYAAVPRRFSPNGDGVLDGAGVTFTLTVGASSVRLDVLNASSAAVAGADLGALPAGQHTASWDGRLAGGTWALPGVYVLRVTATDAAGVHVSPTSLVDPGVLATWGVTADLSPPTVAAALPSSPAPTTAIVQATFNEAVVGAEAALSLVDTTSQTPVAGVSAYDPASRRATFDPTADLEPGRTYTVVVAPSVRDEAGNLIGPAGWSFSVAPPGVTVYQPPRTLSFASGSHTGYQFNGAGQVTATKTYTLGSASTAATSQRNTLLPGQPGAWYLVTNGVWAGYWVKESSRVYLAGLTDQVSFSPWRGVSFAAGSHTGYLYSAAGGVTASKTYTLASASSASASGRAIINSRGHVLIANGVWAGYWVPESASVVLLGASSPPPPPPPPGTGVFDPPRTLSFASGSHTGYQFNSAGQVTATKTYTLGSASTAATSQRTTMTGQTGTWFAVTNGVWAGYWIRESTRVYLAGFVDQITFSPWRGVSFAAGSHTGYQFSSAGGVSASKIYTLGSASGASASARAVINGRAYVLIANGVWAGYWVPESASVVLS
ncbi:MAG: glycosyl hydrolase family 18 protein [Candidatus Limnocylindria bacterium]